MNLVRQCLRFSDMLSAFVRRELRQRYIGSLIGWPWPFIQPLVMLAVYYLVFAKLMGLKLESNWGEQIAAVMGGDPSLGTTFYILLLCCGLLPWLMTAEFLVRSVNTIPENGNLVKKVAFPAELLPVSLVTSYAINLVVIFAVFCLIAWTATPFVSGMIWLFPVVLLLHVIFLLGLAYLLATANVFVRDVNQLAPLAINLWFFLTPIVYTKETLAANPDLTWMWIFDVNPMAYMVDLYRYALIYPTEMRFTLVEGEMTRVTTEDVFARLGLFALIAVATFAVGYSTFMAKKHKFADEI